MTKQLRLLLAESDPEVLLVIPPFMKRVGKVLVARTPEEALTTMSSEVVQILVISDAMIEADGEKIIHALRSIEPMAQIMVLCERQATDVPTWLLAEGVGDVLVKPFDIAELVPRLEKLVEVMEEKQRRARIQQEFEAKIRHRDRITMLGTLVATVAHEVANPLSVIVNNAALVVEMLEEGEPDDPIDREFIESSSRDTLTSGLVIKEYLTRILSFSRQESHTLWDTNLLDALKTALLLIQSRARDRNVRIHFDESAIIPTVPHHTAAFAQAVVNALSNAIDAAEPQGNVWMHVEDVQFEHRDCVMVIICDDGSGLSEEVHRRLCIPFFTTKQDGTGLGTTVIRQVMHDHGGSAEWTNRKGGGVQVRLMLPKKTTVRSQSHRRPITDR